jgi:hypothetical protein
VAAAWGGGGAGGYDAAAAQQQRAQLVAVAPLPVPPHIMPPLQQLQLLQATRGILAPPVYDQAQASVAHMLRIIAATHGGLVAMPPAARAQFSASCGTLQAHKLGVDAANMLNAAVAMWRQQLFF